MRIMYQLPVNQCLSFAILAFELITSAQHNQESPEPITTDKLIAYALKSDTAVKNWHITHPTNAYFSMI
jgi:hypothetical protein